MNTIPTVKIHNPWGGDGYVVINERDFDPALHRRWEEEEPGAGPENAVGDKEPGVAPGNVAANAEDQDRPEVGRKRRKRQ